MKINVSDRAGYFSVLAKCECGMRHYGEYDMQEKRKKYQVRCECGKVFTVIMNKNCGPIEVVQ